MIIDRKKAPNTSISSGVNLPPFDFEKNLNGTPIYFVHDPNCSVLRLEFIYKGGSREQNFPYQSQAASSLLTEGTLKFNSKQIADGLDKYGSYVQPRISLDDSSLTLYSLPEHLEKSLEYIIDCLENPQYFDNELITHKRNAIQRLKINENKTNFLSRRAYYKYLFGDDNWLGRSVYQEDIEYISRETLLDFFLSHYKNRLSYIICSGYIDDSTRTTLKEISKNLSGKSAKEKQLILEQEPAKGMHQILKSDSFQSSLRIGKRTINRYHTDFRKLQFLNLILGGYFGSRLMKNIREEKGLTYGIYSTIESYKNASSFFIETDMNHELCSEGVSEILKELSLIRNEPVPEKEIQIAGNYLIGTFIRSFDGPFSMADRYKILIDYNLPVSYYDEYIEIIKSTKALELQEIANRYLTEDNLITVIVGKE